MVILAVGNFYLIFIKYTKTNTKKKTKNNKIGEVSPLREMFFFLVSVLAGIH